MLLVATHADTGASLHDTNGTPIATNGTLMRTSNSLTRIAESLTITALADDSPPSMVRARTAV